MPHSFRMENQAASCICHFSGQIFATPTANQDVYFSPDGLRFHSLKQARANGYTCEEAAWFCNPVLKPFPVRFFFQEKADVPQPEPNSEAVAGAQQHAVVQAFLIVHIYWRDQGWKYPSGNNKQNFWWWSQKAHGWDPVPNTASIAPTIDSKHRLLQLQSKRGINFL